MPLFVLNIQKHHHIMSSRMNYSLFSLFFWRIHMIFSSMTNFMSDRLFTIVSCCWWKRVSFILFFFFMHEMEISYTRISYWRAAKWKSNIISQYSIKFGSICGKCSYGIIHGMVYCTHLHTYCSRQSNTLSYFSVLWFKSDAFVVTIIIIMIILVLLLLLFILSFVYLFACLPSFYFAFV